MDDLPLPQEFNDLIDVGIVTEPQNVVVGNPSFLLCCQVLRQIGDGIALDLHGRGCIGPAGSCRREHAGAVVYEIGCKAAVFNLGVRQVSGQLVNDGADHLQVPQLFGTCLRNQMTPISRLSSAYAAGKGGASMKQMQYAKLTEIKNNEMAPGEGFLRHLKACLLQILQREMGK